MPLPTPPPNKSVPGCDDPLPLPPPLPPPPVWITGSCKYDPRPPRPGPVALPPPLPRFAAPPSYLF